MSEACGLLKITFIELAHRIRRIRRGHSRRFEDLVVERLPSLYFRPCTLGKCWFNADVVNATRSQLALLGGVVAGVLILLILERTSKREAVRQNLALLGELERANALLKEKRHSVQASESSVTRTAELERDHQDLLRLRNEVGRLREENRALAYRLTSEVVRVESVLRAFADAFADALPQSEEMAFEPDRNCQVWLSQMFQFFAMTNGGVFPSSIAELKDWLAQDTSHDLAWWEAQYEIMPGEHSTNSPPETVLARTRAPDRLGRMRYIYTDSSMRWMTNAP